MHSLSSRASRENPALLLIAGATLAITVGLGACGETGTVVGHDGGLESGAADSGQIEAMDGAPAFDTAAPDSAPLPDDSGPEAGDGGDAESADASSDAAILTCTIGCGTPVSCATFGYNCGFAVNPCGGAPLSCGTCTAPQVCGGGGPNVCGVPPDGGSCVPETCQQQHVACGIAGDGCGGQLDCTPDCQGLGYNCGTQDDTCGSLLSCGTCSGSQVCGGGGPGVCGAAPCTPKTCAELGFSCGLHGDGCGNQTSCGSCPSPSTCGACGPGACGIASPAP